MELLLAPRVIHKPNKAGTGQALKLELRLAPQFVAGEKGGYYDPEANKEGGLFLELAGQGPAKNGFATFDWQTVLRCKLGVPDLTGLLLAIRNWRQLGYEVPGHLQGKAGKPNTVTLFHKTPTDSTIITYEFGDSSSVLRISKGKDLARSISLSLTEEFLFERYLALSLDAHLKTGKR